MCYEPAKTSEVQISRTDLENDFHCILGILTNKHSICLYQRLLRFKFKNAHRSAEKNGFCRTAAGISTKKKHGK